MKITLVGAGSTVFTKNVLGDTLGIGGIFRALRTIPVLRAVAIGLLLYRVQRT